MKSITLQYQKNQVRIDHTELSGIFIGLGQSIKLHIGTDRQKLVDLHNRLMAALLGFSDSEINGSESDTHSKAA